MDQLDEVTNEAHDREADSDSLGDLDKLCVTYAMSERHPLEKPLIVANLYATAWYTW